jgi:hypothetical protein
MPNPRIWAPGGATSAEGRPLCSRRVPAIIWRSRIIDGREATRINVDHVHRFIAHIYLNAYLSLSRRAIRRKALSLSLYHTDNKGA